MTAVKQATSKLVKELKFVGTQHDARVLAPCCNRLSGHGITCLLRRSAQEFEPQLQARRHWAFVGRHTRTA